MTGEYDGDFYVAAVFGTGESVGYSIYRVGHEAHNVRLMPPSCDCGDWIWNRKEGEEGLCRHIKAVRHLLKESKGCDSSNPR